MATVPDPLKSETIVEGMTDAAYMEKKKLAFCAVKKAMDMLVEVTEPNCGARSSLPAGLTFGVPTKSNPSITVSQPQPKPNSLNAPIANGVREVSNMLNSTLAKNAHLFSAVNAKAAAAATNSNASSVSASSAVTMTPPAMNTTVASPPLTLSSAVKSDKDKLKEVIDGTLAELEGKGDSSKADLDSVSALIDTLEKKEDQKSYKDRVKVIMNSITERDDFLTKINDANSSGSLKSVQTNLNNFGSNSLSAPSSVKTLTQGHTQFLRKKMDLKKDDLALKESRIKPNLTKTAGMGTAGSTRAVALLPTTARSGKGRRVPKGGRRKTQKRR